MASSTATLLEVRVRAARELGATDDQIRLAGQIGVTARRGVEKEVDVALARALGDTTQALHLAIAVLIIGAIRRRSAEPRAT